jgi:peptidoglycan L-alanyl-D-glutamate endopeptidase CwlK
MSRSLQDLHPLIAAKANELQEECDKLLGIKIIITSTLRTFTEQAALYAQGRNLPGKIVTNAKSGESIHNYGLAFDFAIMKDGKVDWDDIPSYKKVGEQGEDLGLQWGGRFKVAKDTFDYPHLQLDFGLNIATLLGIYNKGGISEIWAECTKKHEAGLWP